VHRRLAQAGWFVAGNRTLLSRSLTEKILGEKLVPEGWSFASWIAQRLRGGVNRLSALVSLPLGPLRTFRHRRWRGARSCNLAIWRADLDRIDGFDAVYSGWGKEDSDIVVRLLHSGVRRKDGTFATGVLHLWYAEADRSALTANESRLFDIISSDRIRARRGLSSLGKTPAAAQAAG
jgi:N-terminal domain of galactosyltransferase